MNAKINENTWSHTALLWMIILIWFCANLLSQAIFVGLNDYPYGAESILNKLEDWHWALVGVELLICIFLVKVFLQKFFTFYKVSLNTEK